MVEIFTTESCPRCAMIKQRLMKKGIDFIENRDEDKMKELGFMTVPMIKLEDDTILDFGQAISWINSL